MEPEQLQLDYVWARNLEHAHGRSISAIRA